MNLGNKSWPAIAFISMVIACGAVYYHYTHPKTIVVEKERIITKELSPAFALEVYLPKNNQKLILKENEPVKFIWSGWDKEAHYQLTVQNEFNETANLDLKTNEVELKIEKGSYFRWSLKSVSPKYGIKSAQGEFSVEKETTTSVDPLPERLPASQPETIVAVEPVSFNVTEKKIELNYPNNSIRLSWRGNEKEKFRFLITRLQDKKVVVEDEVLGLERPVFFTNPGAYKISLMELNKESKQEQELDSLVITFNKKVAAFDEIQPLDISGSSVQVNYKIFEGESVRLRAFFKDTKKEIGNFKVSGKSHRLVLNKKGEYCFELLNIESPRDLASSGPVCAKFGADIDRKIASTTQRAAPIGQTILNYYKIDGIDTYQFDLPEVKGATSYQIRLYSDPKAENLLREVTLSSRRVFWKTQRELKTYIQYRALSKTQELTPWSETGELIFPISPLEIN